MVLPETDLHRIRLGVHERVPAIYWRDRNLKFHEYKRKRPTKNVRALLYLDSSGAPIFWG